MSKQEARNTAAGMVRDALEQLTKWERVQDLRHFDNTKEEAARLLDLAEAALLYFEHHYDFPQTQPPRKCWAVVSADPKSDEPGYLAYTSLYATREAALEALRNSAAEDAETIDGEVKWWDEDTDEPWCQVCYCNGDVWITHYLQLQTISGNEVMA
jgi:hypothetical protein